MIKICLTGTMSRLSF